MANTKIPSELVAINAISGTLIADNAITSVHIAENNITAVQIAINAVTALQMADGTITSAKIADGTIVTADIADGQITTGKLADSSVTTGKIAAGTIASADIANNAILTQHIDDNQITADQIADNAVGVDQLAGITRGSVLTGNAAGNPSLLALGAANTLLQSDGTDLVFAPLQSGIDDNSNAVAITIDSSEKVGIGGAPSFTFQVRSPSSTAYNAYNFLTSPNIAFSNASSGAGYYNSLLFGTESNGEVAIGSVQNSSNVAADLVVAIRSGGNRLERMRVTSDGNVGIGTSSPDAKLHISGNSDVSDENCQLIIDDVDGSAGSRIPSIQFRSVTGGTTTNQGRIRATDTQGMILSGSSAQGDDLVVQAGGVGIGTSSPGSLLHIQSNDSTTNSEVDMITLTTLSTGTTTTGFGPAIKFQAERNNGVMQNVGKIRSVAEINSGTNISSGLAFETSAVGVLNEKMRITYAGIVDIGKSAFSSYPTGAKLNVYGDGEGFRLDGTGGTSRSIRFRNVGTNGSSNAIIISDGSMQLMNEDANAAMYFNSVRDMEFQVTSGNGTAGNITFKSYNTEVMRIDGANNRVGIGADNPLALLHINGTGDAIRVESTNTGQGGAQMDLLHYTSSPADGDIPGVINFGGYYSGTSSAYSAAIRSVWSNAGGREGQLQFITRQSGSQFDTQLTINHQGHMHLGHDKSSVQFYVGQQGGIMGGNASHNVRGAGNLFMLNAGGTNGSYIFEANGTARLAIANDGVSLASAAPSADSYTHKFRSSNSADPGILLYREGQCGLGITVRNAAVDYASFLVGSSGASTSYDTEAGTTNVPLRIYQNGNVVLGRGAHTYNSNDGHIFYSNGRWASTFNYNSAGAEIYIQDNRTASGTVAAFQYRINNSAQSGGTIYAGTNGYTGGNFSDYRLKNNVENLTGSLDKINALRVVSYNHVDSPDLTELGVIAHEIQEVFPEFVRGEKDAVWTQTDIDNYEGTLPDVEAGDIRAQQVDYFSKEWTSHFIKAIQEQQTLIESLTARIETLEG
jgi:hypothetical protein